VKDEPVRVVGPYKLDSREIPSKKDKLIHHDAKN